MARKKAPHHGKVWLTEEKICDQLAANDFAMLKHLWPASSGEWLREYEIGDMMRPDFVLIGADGYAPSVGIVEVKITADVMSAVQLVHYATLVRQSVNHWHGEIYKATKRGHVRPNVDLLLVARYFDKTVEPFIHCLATERGPLFSAARVSVDPAGDISVDYEEPDFHLVHSAEPIQERLMRLLPVREAAYGAH